MDVDAVHSLGEEVEERVRTHSAVERTVLCGGWDSEPDSAGLRHAHPLFYPSVRSPEVT